MVGSSCCVVEARQLGQPLGAVGDRAVAAQAVDRPPPRGGRDPGARVGRHAVAPPRRDRRRERVLHRVLGELEVAGLADQRRPARRPLLAERALDGGRTTASAATRGGAASSDSVGAGRRAVVRPLARRAATGRTSIVPQRAVGMPRGVRERLVEVGALDEVEAGQHSLVTANGPSVISVSPSRTRTVVALSAERSALDVDQDARPRAGCGAAPGTAARPRRARPGRPRRPPPHTPAACTEPSLLQRRSPAP